MPCPYAGLFREWKCQTWGLSTLFDPIGHPLGDHYGGGVGVGADDVGHHRCVYYPQPLKAMDVAVLVDNGHRVGTWTHLAGARDMVLAVAVGHDQTLRLGVVGHDLSGGDELLNYMGR